MKIHPGILPFFSLSLGLALLGIGMVALPSTILGVHGLLLYLLGISALTGRFFFPLYPRYERWIFGFIITISTLLLSTTFVYYLYKITPLLSFLTLFVPLVGLGFFPKKLLTVPAPSPPLVWKIKQETLAFLVILFDLFLLGYLILHRTFELSPSPWQNVSPLFFLVYLVATFLLLWHTKKANGQFLTALTSAHFFVGLSVAALLYPLGYGFDAFIHRATEAWIFDHGFIAPKTPYYIGQYSFITALTHLTHLPLKLLDIFFVPVLSALLLPPVITFSLQKSFALKKSASFFLFWIVSIIPFFSLHLTTPHNTVILFTLITAFCILLTLFGSFPVLLLVPMALLTVATHALVGVPLLVVIFFLFITKKIVNKKNLTLLLLFLVICLSLLLPLLFTLNSLRIDAPLPLINNPLAKIPEFLSLFERPYWYAKSSPFVLELLYFFERLIIPTIFILAFVGASKIEQRWKNKQYWIFTVAWLGFVASAFTLSSSIVFPDVVAYEQGDYPRRLLKTSILFLLPSAMYGAWFLVAKLKSFFVFKKRPLFFSCFGVFILSFVLMLMLYLSYPQRNAKARFPGYNVTASDYKTVEWIHNRHADYNYIVLSNQLVSAAALDEYSFAKYFATPRGEIFYYSIPTGGVLYQFYGKMIYEGQKREYMEAAMDVVGVNTAYLVVNNYWWNAKNIIETAKQTADEYYSVDDEKVTILVYRRNVTGSP